MAEDTTSALSNKPALVVVSFRGKRLEIPLQEGTKVGQVKKALAASQQQGSGDGASLEPSDVKLMFKGKVLKNDEEDLHDLLLKSSGNKKKSVYRLVATGVSSAEAQAIEKEFQQGIQHAPRVRDDLTEAGRAETERRRQLGQQMLQKSAAKNTMRADDSKYGFGSIETLNLPNQDKAREILEMLRDDPGIKACMAKHKWYVPSLAELYPEGKVGESEVCVMGLNKNKGQQILLRVRTDDLQGFRKILSIRKVLYHELAHNVYSEHDGDFFLLMRQIERECNELDWTHGAGLSTTSYETATSTYKGGTYRLGGRENIANIPQRELTAQAALSRMTAEEKEIEQNCGCGRKDLFLPSQKKQSNEKEDSNDMDLEKN